MRKSLRNRLLISFFMVLAIFAGGVGLTLTLVHEVKTRTELLLTRYWQDNVLISQIYNLLSDVSLFLSRAPDNPENPTVLQELQNRIIQLMDKVEKSGFRDDFRSSQVAQLQQLHINLVGPVEVLNRLQQQNQAAEAALDPLLHEATRFKQRDLVLDLTIAALAYRDYYVTANPSDLEIFRQQIERIQRRRLSAGLDRLFQIFRDNGEGVFLRRIELRQSHDQIVAQVEIISDGLRERTESYAQRVVYPTGEQVATGLQTISNLLLTSLALGGVAALGVGIILARRISAPLEHAAKILVRLEGGDLDARVEPSGAAEIDTLGRAVNSLAVSLQRSLIDLHETVKTLGISEERYRTLAEQRLELERIINASPTVAFLCRVEVGYPAQFVSQNISQFHYRPEEFLSGARNILQLASSEDLPRLEQAIGERLAQADCHDFTLEYRIVTGNGETRSVDARLFLHRAADGTATHLQGVLLDITEKLRLREQAAQATRLASLGELAAGVAHEINNPNATILLNAALLKDVGEGTLRLLDELWQRQPRLSIGKLSYARLRDELPRLHEEVVASAERIRRIVEDLKEFTRFTPAELRRPVNLNDIAQTAVRLTANTLKRSTDQFVNELDDALPVFPGHAQQLEQVVVNLLLNACQALANRHDSITLRTVWRRDEGALALEVIDQGRGISPQHLPHVIDPFFTTRREQGGTGLGLSVSARIVQEHHGRIEIESAPGTGTTVRVVFPLARQEGPLLEHV
ncbi:MAG: hypothetical protein A2091_13810 [Desulfuromonadales bacterium GWD2_61_12]|nr:MAG: hypothetical protein A2005_06420 [Desulfuromonadales bacterium GWC2_61_20]OGR33414.1 MAG: hypothetical protein A2091_13810 [Desulfuromonadales bacterium GWD2_61_12]HAD04353.1 hypothetical protein [Desulfuromonas sp.]